MKKASSRQVGLYELVVTLLDNHRAMWLVMQNEHVLVGSTLVGLVGESACCLLSRATLAGERECFERSYRDLARVVARGACHAAH
jgi:hypothetical protein